MRGRDPQAFVAEESLQMFQSLRPLFGCFLAVAESPALTVRLRSFTAAAT